MIIGDEFGNIHLFENTAGTGNTAVFALEELQYFDLTVGNYSHPTLYDLNNDGLLDLVVGMQALKGSIAYFWNFGTALNAEFHQDSSNLALGSIEVAEPGFINGFSAPTIIEDGGDVVLYVGSDWGFVSTFKVNPDSLLTGSFDQLSTGILSSKVGIRSNIAIADINDDGDLDYFLGNSRGGVHMYSDKLTDPSLVLPIDEVSNVFEMNMYPNPTNGLVAIETPDHFSQKEVVVRSIIGSTVMSTTFNGSNIILDTETFPSGYYIVTVSAEGYYTSSKLLVLE